MRKRYRDHAKKSFSNSMNGQGSFCNIPQEEVFEHWNENWRKRDNKIEKENEC
jgi:hypothetical protein